MPLRFCESIQFIAYALYFANDTFYSCREKAEFSDSCCLMNLIGNPGRRYFYVLENGFTANHPVQIPCVYNVDNITGGYFDRGIWDQQGIEWTVGCRQGDPSVHIGESESNAIPNHALILTVNLTVYIFLLLVFVRSQVCLLFPGVFLLSVQPPVAIRVDAVLPVRVHPLPSRGDCVLLLPHTCHVVDQLVRVVRSTDWRAAHVDAVSELPGSRHCS